MPILEMFYFPSLVEVIMLNAWPSLCVAEHARA